MKIGIDARLWSQTGIGRYIRNICINLEKIDTKNEYILFVRGKDREDVKRVIKNKNWKLINANFLWHSISEQVRFPKVINKENLDLMHFPYQQGVPVFYKKPYVITIHDLVRHHFITGKASTNPLWLYGFKMISYRLIINIAARRACRIIAVSNSTKREIMDHLRVKGEKIDIIYEAADDFNADNPGKLKLDNYFLYVGNIYPHKNVDFLIKAFERYLEKNPKVKLVFVGSRDKFYDTLLKNSKKMIDYKNLLFVENVTDERLARLYQGAICFVRPSLMEGFSLPPLEALSSRCLVLASNITTHQEIFGDAIIYFDPYNIEDLIGKLNLVTKLDKKTKEKYINKGLKLASTFSWENAARKTLNSYESCLSIRPAK